jgi:predicted porin
MNKKLVAAALGLAFAAPVFADASNVTLYGRVHQAFDHQSTETGAVETGGNFTIRDVASRLGVKGEEDLGGGLSAVFAYEFGVDSDAVNTGATNMSTRHAYLGLKGGFGTLVIGSQDGGNLSQAPVYNQASMIGSVSNNGGPLQTVDGGTLSNATAIARTQRVGNSLGYQTKVAGIDINARHALRGNDNANNNTGAVTNNVVGSPIAGEKENGSRETEVTATYKLGALTVGGGLQLFDQQGQDPTVAAKAERIVQGVATYKFGAFTLGGLLAQTKLYANNAANAQDDNTEFALSGTYALTSNSGVFGMYADSERNNLAAPTDVTQTQIAYYYDFSKRTRTYVGYNRLNTQVKATGVDTDADNFTIGLRHNF